MTATSRWHKRIKPGDYRAYSELTKNLSVLFQNQLFVDKSTNNSEITVHLKEEMPPIKPRQDNHVEGAKVVALSADSSNISDIINSAQINISDDLPKPEIVARLIQNYKELILFTLSNFSVITGKAKSKKTFFCVLVIACLLLAKESLPLQPSFPAGRDLMVWIDTEQSRYKVQQTAKRVLATAGVSDADNLLVFSLRAYPPETRLAAIEAILYMYKDRVAFVVIDGIRDLANDFVMDSKDANLVITKLMRWSEELKIHILTVLHQNKGDTNVRGHGGTEATNKAEIVISISKDRYNPNVCVVTPEYCRELEFEPFGFSIDEHGIPHFSGLSEEPEDSKKGFSPFTISEIEHKDILKDVFAGGRQMKYKDLWQAVKLSLLQRNKQCGDNKAKDFVAYYKRQGLLRLEGVENTRTAIYTFTGLM